ncbi:GPI-anchored small secreted protein [Mycena sanguinolenta]|nr:GPI-anchored small secreted protein [Mycena sanguinolenta]
MFSPIAFLAAFVASVSGFTILTPNPSKGWTNDGQNTITWTSDASDPANFTILLENLNNTSAEPQQLAALVVTSDGNTTVNPPSEGWPAVGGNYVVQFVQSTENITGQLAKSDAFSIEAPAVSSGSNTQSSTATTPATTPANQNTGSGASSTGSSSPSPSATGSSAALPNMSVHTGLVGGLVLLSALLAQL